jgi:hypothetical protein
VSLFELLLFIELNELVVLFNELVVFCWPGLLLFLSFNVEFEFRLFGDFLSPARPTTSLPASDPADFVVESAVALVITFFICL